MAWVLVVALTLVAIGGTRLHSCPALAPQAGRRPSTGTSRCTSADALLTPRQYEQRLRRALEQSDWHGAWLAAWLQLLARLENRHLVDADRSRTNREYLAQLRGQPLPPAALPLIARLVDDYDRFIYGLRAIDEAGWTAFRERIDEVTLLLNLRERAGRRNRHEPQRHLRPGAAGGHGAGDPCLVPRAHPHIPSRATRGCPRRFNPVGAGSLAFYDDAGAVCTGRSPAGASRSAALPRRAPATRSSSPAPASAWRVAFTDQEAGLLDDG